MSTVNITNARQNLYQLVKDVNTNSEPIMIFNNSGENAVLISENDWNAIQETFYLNSMPNVVNSIIEGGNEPITECRKYNGDEVW